LRLLVRMTKPSTRVGLRWKSHYETFECLVVRLRGPVLKARDVADFIHADVELPEKYREDAMQSLFNADGTYQVQVVVNHNAKSLGPFLASGDLEWDVREMA
jgi:hypothetical protein